MRQRIDVEYLDTRRLVVRPTREDAWKLLNEHVSSDSLIKHALAVEAAMRYYAREYGQDEEL